MLVFQQKSYKADTMLIQELRSNGFTVFWSERIYRKKRSMMFLALKKNGAMKNASKPELKHKSVQFMVMLFKRTEAKIFRWMSNLGQDKTWLDVTITKQGWQKPLTSISSTWIIVTLSLVRVEENKSWKRDCRKPNEHCVQYIYWINLGVCSTKKNTPSYSTMAFHRWLYIYIKTKIYLFLVRISK